MTTTVIRLDYDGQGLLLRLTENGNVRRLVRDRIDLLARPARSVPRTVKHVVRHAEKLEMVEAGGIEPPSA